MTITTSVDFSRSRRVRFLVEAAPSGTIQVAATRLAPTVSDEDARWVAAALHLDQALIRIELEFEPEPARG